MNILARQTNVSRHDADFKLISHEKNKKKKKIQMCVDI